MHEGLRPAKWFGRSAPKVTMKFRKGDSVVVAKGKDSGKRGKIEKILANQNAAVVGGLNLYKKNLKPGMRGNKEGGIIDIVKPIALANLRVFCEKCGMGRRVGFKLQGEKKMRVCRKCGAGV